MRICKNCKHFWYGGFNGIACGLNSYTEINPVRGFKYYNNLDRDFTKNKNGDCKYYARQWWKFWVRGEK